MILDGNNPKDIGYFIECNVVDLFFYFSKYLNFFQYFINKILMKIFLEKILLEVFNLPYSAVQQVRFYNKFSLINVTYTMMEGGTI